MAPAINPDRPERPGFYLTTVAGIESVAAEEVSEVGGRVVTTRSGKVFLCYAGDVQAVLGLRSAMNLLAFVEERSGCPPDRSAQGWFEDAGRELDLGPALKRHASVRPPPAAPSFRITASRTGEHDYTSPEIAAWVGTGVLEQTGWRVDLEHPDYTIAAELVNDRAIFGLLLSEGWQQRRRKPAYHPAALNPTVAYAMIRLCEHGPDDVFLDPACGGGTLLLERAAFGPARLILGGDIWPRALAYSRRNAAAFEVPASLVRWDAGRLALRSDCVSSVASNLPFGHRVGRAPSVRRFHHRLLPELARVMLPGGRAALLTSRHR